MTYDGIDWCAERVVKEVRMRVWLRASACSRSFQTFTFSPRDTHTCDSSLRHLVTDHGSQARHRRGRIAEGD